MVLVDTKGNYASSLLEAHQISYHSRSVFSGMYLGRKSAKLQQCLERMICLILKRTLHGMLEEVLL